jgi:ATP-dependent Lhr-like helicase
LIADVLRAMEDAGTVRRGYFVEHLDGAQFAWPGAIDRLREAPRGQASRVDVLAAVDPACAWGSVLVWPALRDREARPARRVGASVVLVDGALALWLEPRGKRIATGEGVSAEAVALALTVGLPRIAGRQRRRELLVETIDGEVASTSSHARALLAAGARIDYRGLVVRSSSTAPPPEAEPEPDGEDGEDAEAPDA